MAESKSPEQLLSENLEPLRARDPRFVEELTRESAGDEGETERHTVEIITARSGEPTAKVDGTLLHSRFDPRKEADRVAQRYRRRGEDQPRDATVLCGLGLGYQLETLLTEGNEPIIVVEPDRSLFLFALRHRNLRAAFADRRTNLVIGRSPRTVIELLKTLECRYPDSLQPASQVSQRSEYFDELLRGLGSFRKRNEVNAATLTRFGKLWIRNLLVNTRKLAASPGLDLLEDAFAGMPFILVAAGPTLDAHYAVLEELRERCVLLAVDTAVPLLERRGLRPDITVVVDPQYWNSRHLDYLHRSGPLLLAEPSTHPRVFRLLDTFTLFSGSFFPLGRYIETVLPGRTKLGAGGSVATSAWDAARIAGAREIYTVGLDLGFPERKTHARGSFFEERGHTLSHRLAGIEDYSFRYLRSGEPHLARDNAGNPLLSDRRMQMYAWWFESQGTLYPEVHTYTLDSRSLGITGHGYKDPRELAALPPRREEINRRIAEIRRRAESVAAQTEGRVAAIGEAAVELAEEIRRVAELAEEGREKTEALLERLEATGDLTGAELATLDKVDGAIARIPNRDVLGFLMQEVDRETRKPTAGGDRRRRLSDTLRRSYRIYRELREAARFHETLFTKLLHEAADKKSVE